MVEDTGAATAYSAPRGGASLMLSFRLESKTVVVVGGNNLAAARAFAALEADARVVVICAGGAGSACAELQWRASQGHLQIIDPASFQFSSPSPVPHSTPDGDTTLLALADLLSSSEERVQLVCVTDTMLGSPSRRSHASAAALARTCRTNGVPISVADEPVLCDFSFAAVHRFTDPATGEKTPLQIAVSTSGQGCRLAGRVRREIVSRLPKAVGGAAAGVARLRALARANIKRELPAAPRAAPIVNGNTDHQVNGNADTPLNNPADVVADFEAEASEDFVTPNAPVPQRVPDETPAERARRQMRWVAQVSEYWPLAQLAQLTDADASRVLTGDFDTVHGGAPSASAPTRPLLTHLGDTEIGSSFHLLALAVPPAPPPRKGRILLVGSGPGHPALLTRATHTALTELADLVLSDKLVPAPILALVPPQTEVRIARKFPGNAEGAQQEMMEAAVAAAERGLTVVRLKQGDPTVYGRVGEEVLYFRARGFEPVVIPGVSSALAGPAFAGISATQRGAAESVVLCTGVGRGGTALRLPGYERGRTLLVLMGVARLGALVDTLSGAGTGRDGEAYPPHMPIAIVERASMPDQRAIFSTVRDVVAALESVGEQRPPGMIIVGWAVLALWGAGDMSVLDEDAEKHDEERVSRWLDDKPWRVVEGVDEAWDAL